MSTLIFSIQISISIYFIRCQFQGAKTRVVWYCLSLPSVGIGLYFGQIQRYLSVLVLHTKRIGKHIIKLLP